MRLCFQRLRPRLSRLEMEDRGMSSSGVTFSQSSAVRMACFKLNRSGLIIGGSMQSADRSLRSYASPASPSDMWGPVTGIEQWKRPR